MPPKFNTTAYGIFMDENEDSLAQVGETVQHNITVVNTGKVISGTNDEFLLSRTEIMRL